jgi:hypothetical protein
LDNAGDYVLNCLRDSAYPALPDFSNQCLGESRFATSLFNGRINKNLSLNSSSL